MISWLIFRYRRTKAINAAGRYIGVTYIYIYIYRIQIYTEHTYIYIHIRIADLVCRTQLI